MAVLVRPKRWSRKPPPGVAVNRGHPLANGLVGVWLFNEGAGMSPRELLSRTSAGASTFGSWTEGSDGPAIALSGTNQYCEYPDASRYTATSKGFSIVARCWLNTNTDVSPICSKDQTGQREFRLAYFTSSTVLRFALLDNTTGAFMGRQAPFTLLNRWRHVVATYNGGTTPASAAIYLEGIRADTTDAPSGGTFTQIRDTSSPFHIGEVTGGTGYWPGRIGYVYMFNRALTAREAQQLYVDPYAFFVPQAPRPRLWTVPAAGGATQALAGTTSGASTTSGALTVAHSLAGTTTGTATTSSALRVTHSLNGTSTGVSTTAGTLKVTHALAGTTSGTSTTAAALRVAHSLNGTTAGTATTAGTLSNPKPLAGTTTGTSTTSGALRVAHALMGTTGGQSSTAGAIRAAYSLTGSTASTASTAGALSVQGAVHPVTWVDFDGMAGTVGQFDGVGATSGQFEGAPGVAGQFEGR